MYIKSVIIDGFKSYGRRTEINDFDPQFTAITGLNGTGKSNILDSICFVLGISNLTQVRAASLQDLVYKSGQAGVTKATVTLVFDNSNAQQSPFGYEKCRDISVTRQIVVGGKNKYLINGKIVQNKKVVDFFCSIQLNVNNPNFLIMQGRITKVLNMKPQEILSMIEEAAGTSMYETKREATTKLMEKKDAKLRETESVLKEIIEPRLHKLRDERSAYLEFQKICRDIEYLTRIHISFKYLKQKESFESAEKNLKALETCIENYKQTIVANEKEVVQCDAAAEEIQSKIDNESGGELAELEKIQHAKSTEEAQLVGKVKGLRSDIDQENRKLKTLNKGTKDDEKVLQQKESNMEKVGGQFEALKKACEDDEKAYTEAQKKFEAVTQGLSTNEDGQASSLQDQLMTAKGQIIEAQTTIKTSEMELKHSNNTLRQKMNDSQTNDVTYEKDKKLHDNIAKEIDRLNNEMSKLNYQDGYLEELENQRIQLTQEIRNLKSQLNSSNAYNYDLQYQDPEPNFDRSKVRGMVGKLFQVKDDKNCLALTICAGGNLYSYVTDDDVTSKKILQNGRLPRRVTIMPLNKISYSSMNHKVVQTAQSLVGRENVASASSLINYDPKYEPIMQYIFGRTFICKDMNIAKQVTFHRNIMCRSVTLDGDVVDPQGTLSGGSKPKGSNILQQLASICKTEEILKQKQTELSRVNQEIAQVQNVANTYNTIKEKMEVRQHELQTCKQRLAQTTFQQNQQEVEDLKTKIENLEKDLISARELQKVASSKVKDIELKLSDAKGFRERELKAASEAMKAAKKKSENSRQQWEKREQEYQTLQMEIEELKKGLSTSNSQTGKLTENVTNLETKLAELNEKAQKISEEVAELKSQIKLQKDKINSQNRELKALLTRKEKLNKKTAEIQLDIKKKENEITKVENENRDAISIISNMERKYGWIKEDRQFFGTKNTRYDYSKEDPVEAGRKLHKMQEQKEKMERNINLKAMVLLDREEEKYKETMRRKKIVEEDKEKIKSMIHKMDINKREKVDRAWQVVDKNFGSIFSSLLPGADARLKPVQHGTNLGGLQICVGFNGMWKESLGELSGGQRSLVALSLVLAMLKFCPAPLYILDEVDAALDMSHTQNIGQMLKAHFTDSQFIIVSLKDGMFNNANVLFKTKFEEGFSCVTRKENRSAR